MREMPANQLNSKMKNVWRISDSIWIVLAFLCCFVPFAVAGLLLPEERSWILLVLLGELVVLGILIALFIVILPPIRFARWRYEVSEDYLDIAKGIIWRKRYIIPFIRVQNTDTKQGPILRAFGLASVTVSTAAGEHEIPGLALEEAELLRDRAAELARLAREDV